jgi:hypothetical protein
MTTVPEKAEPFYKNINFTLSSLNGQAFRYISHKFCLSSDVEIDEEFFDLHILKQQKDEGWFR